RARHEQRVDPHPVRRTADIEGFGRIHRERRARNEQNAEKWQDSALARTRPFWAAGAGKENIVHRSIPMAARSLARDVPTVTRPRPSSRDRRRIALGPLGP